MRSNRGFTLIEVMIAISILAVIIVVSLSSLVTVQKQTIDNTDKSFAVQKAISLLSELRGVVESTAGASASLLDGYDDGVGTSPMLSINPAAVNPDDTVSGNYQFNGVWAFQRRVTVRRFQSLDARDVRVVTVRVFRASPASNTETLLADVTSVIRTVGDIYPPTQVYDLYVLAIENIPGWWVYMANLKPFIENSLSDLQARNPGLSFRLHWITKSGYGRDPEYKPYVNDTVDSNQPIPSVYYYPGTMPGGSAVGQYYVPSLMTGLCAVDGATRNGYDAAANPNPFSYADMWNNCMRLRDEEALFNARVASGQESADQPTFRLLLERMSRDPAAYRNVIFMNLHGELLPMPSIRNYSDAAKDPVTYPQWRAVAHPENLRNPVASALRYRLYAYLDDFANSTDNLMEKGGAEVPITFRIRDAILTPADVTVTALEGGFDQDGVAGTDNYVATTPALTLPTNNRQYWTMISYVDGFGVRWTEFRFFNTPLRTPPIANTATAPDTVRAGLPNGTALPDATATKNWRLYNRDYIPCATEAANNFSVNLATSGDRPKNTARWIVGISQAALDREFADEDPILAGYQRVVVSETRIGTDMTTGTAWPVRNAPMNLSRTYCWRTNTVADVPFTERYQFTGDPRHCPYADLKDTPNPVGAVTSFTNGYNWYFDNFQKTDTAAANNQLGAGKWEGWNASRMKNGVVAGNQSFDGWSPTTATAGDKYEFDVPRQFQLLRTALVECGAVWTTLTGFSYYYLGIGGEIGYDSANGFPSSIPVNRRPTDGGAGSRFEDSITTAMTGGVKYVREYVAGSNYWWGACWLGELYPDTAAAQWVAKGNLDTPAALGNAANKFVRVRRQDVPAASKWLPLGADWTTNAWVRRTNTRGCTSFFNVGSPAVPTAASTSLFRHNFNSGQDGSIAAPGGSELGNNYNFSLPTTTKISRPFKTNFAPAWGQPDEFAQNNYPHLTASVALRFYGHQADGTYEGCSIVHLNDSSIPGNPKRAYIVISGLDTTTESGTAFIAKMSTLTLIHAFLDGGRPALAAPRITELPRLTVDSPTNVTELLNPATIPVQWNVGWRRWDNLPYTGDASYGAFAGLETDLRYARLYSRDNGSTWQHMGTDAAATPGKVPLADTAADGGAGGETFVWDVSDTTAFPEGSYIIRVECYRASNPTNHYSTHQQKVFIDR
ncbi:MAG: prepilin-type N-terminal cleavage/methylation domain-containing protein [Planctomycetes bacterium]|nr:prepilin-type N-terminal cleavage/methylation domain-containing protein [Planctomycetota bacterium]